MSNESRKELAKAIQKALGDVSGIYDTSEVEDRQLADAIIAAGYRKPRIIETVEELDALPVGSVVIDAFGAACVLINKSMYLGWRRCTPAIAGGEHRHSPYLPATVLHEPEAEVGV